MLWNVVRVSQSFGGRETRLETGQHGRPMSHRITMLRCPLNRPLILHDGKQTSVSAAAVWSNENLFGRKVKPHRCVFGSTAAAAGTAVSLGERESE